MSKVKLAIVEDEALVRKDLERRLSEMGYEIVAALSNYEEAKDFLNDAMSSPDLMIIDIELDGEMLGIDLAKQVNQHQDFPFIYLTSHTADDVVAAANETRPSAYLVKPFHEREIQIAIDLAIKNYAHYANKEKNAGQDSSFIINDSFFIKKKFKYEKVKVEDILVAEAQRNYTLIKTDSESYLLSITLKSVIQRLTYPFFVQSHRSYLLNLNHITGFEGNRIFLGEIEVPVSKNFRETVFKRFRTF